MVFDLQEFFLFHFFYGTYHCFDPQTGYGRQLFPRQWYFVRVRTLIIAQTFEIFQDAADSHFRVFGIVVLHPDEFVKQSFSGEFLDIYRYVRMLAEKFCEV